MTKDDMNYRQGRSKKQVEANEKLGLLSASILIAALLFCLIYSLIW